MLTPDCKHFVDSEDVVFADYEVVENKFVGNTTIGVVLTNAAFQKTQLCKLAGMAHDGYARSIRPVHTSADGDSIYAVSLWQACRGPGCCRRIGSSRYERSDPACRTKC